MANIEKLKEMFATKENQEERGVMKITIDKDGVTHCRSRRYYMTSSDWKTMLATLETQGIDYEHITDSTIVIIKHEKG